MGALNGKVAIVTGASRGIGAQIAKRLATEGAQVVVAARTTETRAGSLPGTIHETVESIRATGGDARAVPIDISRCDEREMLVARVQQQVGDIDILVNNAAVTYFVPVWDFVPRRYELMFEVQVTAPFHLAQLVLPRMRDRQAGWILNVSSSAARHPRLPPNERATRGGTVYGMCKAALERFSTGLAAEVYADGIAVNALSPSRVVPTPGTVFHQLTTHSDPHAEDPTVMAEAAFALCSNEPTRLTGRVTYSQDLLAELDMGVPASSS